MPGAPGLVVSAAPKTLGLRSLKQLRQTIQEPSRLRPPCFDKRVKTFDELRASRLVIEDIAVIGKKNTDDLDKPVRSQRFELKAVHPPGVKQRVRYKVEDTRWIG
jgi:hypothetical protein